MMLYANIKEERSQTVPYKFPDRKRTRLKEYDYSDAGYCFVTICIKEKKKLFGKIIGSHIVLNQFGIIVEECWQDLPNHYPNCELDCYVIMPDHFHGIIIIDRCRDESVTRPKAKNHDLSEIIRGFKTFSSKRINELLDQKETFHWQKSFYDRIIRSEKELFQIRKYILQNPLKWELDRGIPENLDF